MTEQYVPTAHADRAMDREAEAYQAAVNEAIPELARDHAVRQAEVRYQKAAESVWEGIPENTDAVDAYAMARPGRSKCAGTAARPWRTLRPGTPSCPPAWWMRPGHPTAVYTRRRSPTVAEPS